MKIKYELMKNAIALTTSASLTITASAQSEIRYAREKVDGLDIFYREAGNPDRPTLVLLHGFPTSSQMYRKVLDGLKDEYHLIAPDYPGFGMSSAPGAEEFTYTFDRLAEVVDTFLEQKRITEYTLMIHDYGAPIGFRIATAHPERVNGFVIMNGNAYEEGLGREGWGPIFDYWENHSPELGEKIAEQVFSLEGMEWQYVHGTKNPESINPDNWIIDTQRITRHGQKEIQLGLFYDYRNNVKLYPKWQKYLREHQPQTLIVWGKNDAFFPEAGAEAYKRDLNEVDYHILDTGHFALEEEGDSIIRKIRAFMNDNDVD
ncbi:alpha/beta fold hydrolase [Luteolibacter algae]|uniref:Alpha/beta fold hydrolase n=1 Tax=Luteolibacter algae TaxID=454151 RepID=A0ABW5D812_9BACT